MHVSPASSIARWTSLALLGSVLFASWRCVSQVHERRVASKAQPLPEREQVWEGEGG
ncbi:MAG: hypothetical protein IT499_06175, partial [Rubrivivax sp.]|nr:hypothetical protein [Rubrivivax sp.]